MDDHTGRGIARRGVTEARQAITEPTGTRGWKALDTTGGGLSLRVAWASLVLFTERLVPALWPLAGICGLFLSLAWIGVLPLLPGWLHALALAGFLAAALAATWYGARRITWPGLEETARRLEIDSGVPHRPLTTLGDRLATENRDQAAAALWRVYQRSLLASLAKLRIGPPRPVMARIDPLALRGAVGLLLVVALVSAWGDWGSRLGDAFVPRWTARAAGPPPSLDVWINPPAYTGLPPQFLEAAAPAEGETPAVTAPLGSAVLAQVQGGDAAPQLRIAEQTIEFREVTLGAFQAQGEVTASGPLVVQQGEEQLAAWSLQMLPDEIPTIAFLTPPSRTERAILRLEYQAADDYGLSSVTARVARIDNPDIEPMVLSLPLPGVNVRSAETSSYHDLTPHPWAGIAVEITLVASDALDQEGMSDPVRTVLPERIFNHPVARALVELRKQLTLNPEDRLPVVRALSEIYKNPAHFFHDIVVALAIRSAERRLIHDRGQAAVPSVQQLLWDTALRIEEGDLAIAERELREIQQQLMEALANDAPDEEIERLMDALEEALNRFLEALAEQMREQLAQGAEPQPLPPNAQVLDSQELRDLLDKAREMAEGGAREAARDLLARLQEMLENLQANPLAQMLNQQGENAWETLRDMEEMMQQQQELLDRSYQRSQQGDQPGEQEGEKGDQGQTGANQRDSQQQDALRRQLGEMMRRLGDALGEIPRPLGRAEQAMRDAREALDREQPGQAIDPQTRALDQLQQGMEATAEAFMQQMGTPPGQGQGTVGMQPGQGRDPLGRQSGNGGLEALEGVEIPDQMELRRAREILDELRRRRGERSRPPLELDYIDRLLQQF